MKLKIITILLFTITLSQIYSVENKLQYNIENVKYGAKLSLPYLEAGGNIKNTSLSVLPEQYNYGVSLFSDKYTKNFPFGLKYGKLSISGAYSKLNSPLLSASLSPCMNFSTNVAGVTASIPGASAFSNKDSLFVTFGYKNTKKIIQKGLITSLYFPTSNEFLISNQINLSFSKILKSAVSFTTGYFSFDENTFSSWFSEKEKYYHEGNHFCSNIQLGVQTSFIKNITSLNIYETPFNNYNMVFRSENNFKINNINLCFGALVNRNLNLLTCTQEINSPCLQIKSGINKRFLITTNNQNSLFLKAGISSYTKVDLLDDSNIFKLCSGFSVTSKMSTFTSSFTITTNPIITVSNISIQPSSISLQLSECYNLKSLTPTIKINLTYTPEKSQLSQKYHLNFIFLKQPKISFQNTFSLNSDLKNTTKFNETSSIRVNFSKKYVTCFCYLSMIFFADS